MNDSPQNTFQLDKALEKIEFIRNYIDNAFHCNLLSADTYIRVDAGIEYLRYNLLNRDMDVLEDEYEISLPNIMEIISTANNIDIDLANLPVLMYIDKEEEMLKDILKDFFNSDELTPELVDKLLNSIKNLDEKIDNKKG